MRTLRHLIAAILLASFLVPLSGLAADKKADKLKPYTLKTCIISGDKLGEMGDPFVYKYKDREIKFCCKGCLKDFNKEPDKYIKKIRRGRGQGQEGQELGAAQPGKGFRTGVKSLLAILFSAALIWAQTSPVVCAQGAPASAGRSGCCGCHCGKGTCCMNRTSPRPQPTPTAPAPRASQPGQLLLLAPAALAFVLPQLPSSASSPPAASPVRAAALPLYQQNCTFLI